LAEGNGRVHRGDYVHHLSIAHGSLMELETHFLIAAKLTYFETSDLDLVFQLSAEVGRMLVTMTKKLRTPVPDP
jgi:four helix bundle protein